jgi:hypothetical protein
MQLMLLLKMKSENRIPEIDFFLFHEIPSENQKKAGRRAMKVITHSPVF